MADRVLLISTGGTIASTEGPGGAVPTESGVDLLESLPELRDRIYVEQLDNRPSPDMDFDLLARLRERIDEHAMEHDHGVVVTHGTDTMEESAYYLDLVLDAGPPVVFTGAQRRPDQPSSDGPGNVADAVTAATTSALQDAGGVYVCLHGELHAAREVVKAHTWQTDAFRSPNGGPVAVFGPDGFSPRQHLGSRSRTVAVDAPPSGEVVIVPTGIGYGPGQLDRAVAAGCDGIVLQATGLGNASEPIADAVANAVDAGVPVVVTSRCFAGRVAPVYGGGGGHALRERGAIFAGDLPAAKARIKLLAALEAGVDVATAFGAD